MVLALPMGILIAETEEEAIYVLEEFVVSSPIDPRASVLPNDHPFSSVYGYETGILDTPRNVTIVSKAQLNAVSLKDPRDFTKLTTSSYSNSSFGAPTTPSIRGQKADTLVNGMRKGMSNNGNGLPLNMNSVESVNILKGPPSVMIGVSQYVGGYVDLITKRPTGINEGSLSLTVDSEGMRKATLDQNLVLSDTLAFRASITGEDSTDYYWDDYYRQTAAFYAAFDWRPTDTAQFEFFAEYFAANYTENWGINRPTNDLINDRTYVTGTGSFGGFNDSLTTTGTTKIDRTARLHGEGDDSNGEYLSLQAIQTFRPDPDLTFVNNALFQYRDRDTYSAYQYSEVMRDNIRFENRTEARTALELLGIENLLNLGAVFSYQDIWGVNDYYNEPANAWDLANQSYANIGVTDATVFNLDGLSALPTPNTFHDSFPILGEKARGKLSARPGSTSSDYYIPSTNEFILGNADSNDSQTASFAIFLQDRAELNDRFTLLFGGRLDYVHVQSEDPMFDDMIRYLSDLNPGEDYSDVKQAKDSHGDFVPNFNLGLVYKLRPTQRLYANYNYSESIPVGVGGGVPLDNSGKLNHDAFDSDSELLEVGYKGTFLDGTLYAMVNLFKQSRLEPQSQGADQQVEAKGFETELHYQPSERFFIVAGYSYIDSITRNGLNASRQPIDSVPSTGGNYRYATFPYFEGYDAETPGVPKHIINALVSYGFTDEFSMSLGLLVTSPINLAFEVPASENLSPPGEFGYDPGPLNTSKIPWQYSLDLGIKYETDRWAASLHVLNLTDQENWGAVEGLYGNDSIYAELPRRYEFTLTLKW